jgi:hypothetical protein
MIATLKIGDMTITLSPRQLRTARRALVHTLMAHQRAEAKFRAADDRRRLDHAEAASDLTFIVNGIREALEQREDDDPARDWFAALEK